MHSNYSSLPIWLTEFGFPQASTSEVISSLNETITFLDGAEWIERYAYFGTFRQGDGNGYIGQNGAVWDKNGDITGVGKIYLGLQTTPKTQKSQGVVARTVTDQGYLVLLIILGLLLF